jgi:hypothetical protein
MWKRITTVYLDSLPGEVLRFEHRRRYKSQARCEAGACAERVRMSKALRRRLGHNHFRIETRAMSFTNR